jgi:hypothetical protein
MPGTSPDLPLRRWRGVVEAAGVVEVAGDGDRGRPPPDRWRRRAASSRRYPRRGRDLHGNAMTEPGPCRGGGEGGRSRRSRAGVEVWSCAGTAGEDGGDGAEDEGRAGSWFERRRENPRNAVEGGEIFILQMRMQHLLDALHRGFLAHYEDATGFGDVAGDSLNRFGCRL